VKVNAVIFLRVIDPSKAVVEVSNYLYRTSQICIDHPAHRLSEVEFDDLLWNREKLTMRIRTISRLAHCAV